MTCKCGCRDFGKLRRIVVDGKLRYYRKCKRCDLAYTVEPVPMRV